MGQDAQQLRREIANSRADLGQTMDAFEDRVSPSRIIERKKSRMRESVSNLSQRVMGNIDYAKGAATNAAGDIRDGAEHKAADAKTAVANAPGMAQDLAHDARAGAMHQAQGSPLLAGAVAAGIGFVASVVFPGTKAEGHAAQRLQDAAQPLVDQAKDAGTELASSMKEQGQDSAQQLRQSAMDHARDVRDTAQSVADEVKSDAKQTASDAAESARPNQ
jgi:gas vesicle protein